MHEDSEQSTKALEYRQQVQCPLRCRSHRGTPSIPLHPHRLYRAYAVRNRHEIAHVKTVANPKSTAAVHKDGTTQVLHTVAVVYPHTTEKDPNLLEAKLSPPERLRQTLCQGLAGRHRLRLSSEHFKGLVSEPFPKVRTLHGRP